MMELKLQAASVTPVRARGCSGAKRREAACVAQAECENSGRDGECELKLQAAESVTPVRAMSCTRAKQREAACDAQAKGENSSRDDERAEAAGGGERHACQGNELERAEQCRAACAAQAEGEKGGRDDDRA